MFYYEKSKEHPPHGYKVNVNCDEIDNYLKGRDKVSAEELILTFLEQSGYDEDTKDEILWKNSFLICDISPESVGQKAYDIFADRFGLVGCGYHLYKVKNAVGCDNLFRSTNCEDCHYSSRLTNCSHMILSDHQVDKQFMVCNMQVTPEEYMVVRKNLDKIPKGSKDPCIYIVRGTNIPLSRARTSYARIYPRLEVLMHGRSVR